MAVLVASDYKLSMLMAGRCSSHNSSSAQSICDPVPDLTFPTRPQIPVLFCRVELFSLPLTPDDISGPVLCLMEKLAPN
jgi:hypothetical protein